MKALATVVATATFTLPACERTDKSSSPSESASTLVTLAMDRMIIRHDTVGSGQHATQATFVLVDALNNHSRELEVTVGGTLVDSAGTSLGGLRKESLRIPPRASRVFALVHNDDRRRGDATSARLNVTGATPPAHPHPIALTDGNVYRDGDRVVAAAYVTNTSHRPARVLVLAAFLDDKDTPMTRPFSEIVLKPEEKHPVQFVGPDGSRKASIYVGPVVY